MTLNGRNVDYNIKPFLLTFHYAAILFTVEISTMYVNSEKQPYTKSRSNTKIRKNMGQDWPATKVKLRNKQLKIRHGCLCGSSNIGTSTASIGGFQDS